MIHNNDTEGKYIFNKELYKSIQIDGDEVPAGFYRIVPDRHDKSIDLTPLHLPEQDQIIEPPEDERAIKKDMNVFFESESVYQEMDIAYRRGALLYGPPGTGKTFSLLNSVREIIEKYDAIAFMISNDMKFENIVQLRPSFEDRSTIFIIEETSSPQHRRVRGIEDLLSFLDGEFSWDRNYNVATTNYPGDMPSNLIDRPGRFDMIIHMDHPSLEERRKFLNAYLGEDEYDYKVLERLEGYSISYIKEMALRTKLYQKDLHDILDRFDEQKQKISEAFETRDGDLGFTIEESNNGNF